MLAGTPSSSAGIVLSEHVASLEAIPHDASNVSRGAESDTAKVVLEIPDGVGNANTNHAVTSTTSSLRAVINVFVGTDTTR
jgi:hypothetical protein